MWVPVMILPTNRKIGVLQHEKVEESSHIDYHLHPNQTGIFAYLTNYYTNS